MTSNLCYVISKNEIHARLAPLSGPLSMSVFIRGQSSVRLNFNLCSECRIHSAVCMRPTKTIWDIVKL